MSDFDEVIKFPPLGVADVLRRLSEIQVAESAGTPILTLHLTSGSSISGALMKFSKDQTHHFMVTLGNFRPEDGAVEAVSIIPLAQIAALTVHHPRPFTSALMEAPREIEE